LHNGVPFFFKQWGEWAPYVPAADEEPSARLVLFDADRELAMKRIGRRNAGRKLDGIEFSQFPAAP
jgi:hypothetical protein